MYLIYAYYEKQHLLTLRKKFKLNKLWRNKFRSPK